MTACTYDPLTKKILFYVGIVHTFFLAIILFGTSLIPAPAERKPLLIKTITPQATLSAAVNNQRSAAVSPGTLSSPAPAPQAKPPSPSTAHVSPAPPSSLPAKKRPPIADKVPKKTGEPALRKKQHSEQRAAISEQLKRELAESIAQLEEKKHALPFKKSSSSSQKIPPLQLQIDASHPAGAHPAALDQADYPGHLIASLHHSLHLPEFGEVKIQLTLRQDGSIAKLVVLSTESEKNKRYLEANLPCLPLPPFHGSFSEKKEHTFLLTFCNEL